MSDEEILDQSRIYYNDMEYFFSIVSNYILLKFGKNRPQEFKYYYSNYEEKTVYKELMKTRFIAIKATSLKEAKLLDLILKLFINNNLYDNFLKEMLFYFKETELDEFNEMTVEKINFLVNLLDDDGRIVFNEYIIDKNIDEMDEYQLWDLKDILDGQLYEDAYTQYYTRFPQDTDKIGKKSRPILIDNFMNYICNQNDVMIEKQTLLQPYESEFIFVDVYKNKKKILNFFREYDIIFDRVDIIKILSMAKNTVANINIYQILQINSDDVFRFKDLIYKQIYLTFETDAGEAYAGEAYAGTKEMIDNYIEINKYKINKVVNNLIGSEISENNLICKYLYEIFPELTFIKKINKLLK